MKPSASVCLLLCSAFLPAESLAADFPAPEADLAAVLRFVDAIPSFPWRPRPPPPGIRSGRHEIEVVRYDRLPWEKIDADAVLSGEYAVVSEASYGVSVNVSCRWGEGTSEGETRLLWYVVAEGRLRSWDHFDFDRRDCALRASFRRGDEVDLDFLVDLRRTGMLVRYGRTCPSVEAYQRALAYAEAGRTEEAHSLVAFGDRTVELDERGDVARAATGLACIEPARALRRKLRRRLPAQVDGLAPPASFP